MNVDWSDETSGEGAPAGVIDQLGAEQVATLFRLVRSAVIAASGGAIVLAGILIHFDMLATATGAIWSGYISVCAVAHIILREFHVRSERQQVRWRQWGHAFSAIALAEGIGWGWASILLARDDALDVRFLVLLVTQGIGAGSIPAFGAFLPAFLAIFLPTTVPYVFCSLLSANRLEQASGLLMIVYIFGMAMLGLAMNRRFRQVTHLRLQTDRLVAELRRQKEAAQEANQAKSRFLAAASHDLRQPVHALGLFVGALKTKAMPPDVMALVDQIDLSSQSMDSLFAALLDISRLDAGIVEVHRRAFAIDSVLNRLCLEYGAEAATKSLRLSYRPSTAYVDSDPILIERVVRNLVSNAVRYTPKGRVLVGCRHRGRVLTVQVWDTGSGVPFDQRERIFQEYFQLGNIERDRTKGLGLGLAIVRRLTDLVGIPLRLRSTLGRGSCFEIDLPMIEAPPLASGPDAEELVPLRSRLIVVIDDEAPIRSAMLNVLSGWGHRVVVAGSGDEAVELLAKVPLCPDIIICDLRLRAGEMGTAVIEMLRSEYNEPIPAILVTGDTAPDRLLEARGSGLLLLHKPVSNGRLRAALSNVIAHAENVADA